MIKIRDLILKESITGAITIDDAQNQKTLIEIINAVKAMGLNNPILWRGMTAKHIIAHVINDRENFRGLNLGSRTIFKELGIQCPLFTFHNISLTTIFGSPVIVVVKEPYKVFYSDEVDDIMSYAQENIYKDVELQGGTSRTQIGSRTNDEIIQKAKTAVNTFNVYNEIPKNILKHEIIIDAKEYWALGVQSIIARGGKYMPIKQSEFKNIKTYKELIDILYKFKNYLAWSAKKRSE